MALEHFVHRKMLPVDGNGNLLYDPVAIALGGYSGITIETRFGHNTDVDGAEDIWGGDGTYTGFPTGDPELVQVVSSSANDAAAGTGARTVRITGLKTATSEVYETEDIILNGTTPVDSANTWWRVNDCKVLTAGSGGENAGTITGSHKVTTANVFFNMIAGLNKSSALAYTVPFNCTAIIRRIHVAVARANGSIIADVSFRIRESGGVFVTDRLFTVGAEHDADITYIGGIVLPALTDVKMRVDGVSAINADVTGEFEYILFRGINL